MTNLTEKLTSLETALAAQHANQNVLLSRIADASEAILAALTSLQTDIGAIASNTALLAEIRDATVNTAANAAISAGQSSEINGKMNDANDRLLALVTALGLVKLDTANIQPLLDAFNAFTESETLRTTNDLLLRVAERLDWTQTIFAPKLTGNYTGIPFATRLLEIYTRTNDVANNTQFLNFHLTNIDNNTSQMPPLLTAIRDCTCGGTEPRSVCDDYTAEIQAMTAGNNRTLVFDGTVVGTPASYTQQYWIDIPGWIAPVTVVDDPSVGQFRFTEPLAAIFPQNMSAICMVLDAPAGTEVTLYLGEPNVAGWNVTTVASPYIYSIPPLAGRFFAIGTDNAAAIAGLRFRIRGAG